MQDSSKGTYKPRKSRGFRRVSTLVQDRIRNGGASRGFAVSRLLTHWADIVGKEAADCTRPVNVSYGKGGMGATLTILVKGAMAPMLQMNEPKLREKVNACYGYNAISRIRFTQTAAVGFAEGQAEFAPAPKMQANTPDPVAEAEARDLSQGVSDPDLRELLKDLGTKVLSKSK